MFYAVVLINRERDSEEKERRWSGTDRIVLFQNRFGNTIEESRRRHRWSSERLRDSAAAIAAPAASVSNARSEVPKSYLEDSHQHHFVIVGIGANETRMGDGSGDFVDRRRC